jgi:acetone carboxylase gamma subunit
VEQLEPNMSGKSYMQNNKKKRRLSFAEDKLRQLEYCHNLVAQVEPDEDMIIEYGSNKAMFINKCQQTRSILCPTIHVAKGVESIWKERT